MISAIIMASGFGRRMGKNKLLLPYKNKAVVEYIIEKVMECDFLSKVLVAKDEEVLKIGVKKGIKVIKNNNAFEGQSESIKIGIDASKEADGYMFFTADQPLLDVETIELLINTFENNNNCIVLPVHKNKKGNPVIFPKRFVNELKLLQGDTGGKSVVNNHINDIITVDIKNECALFDIDTWQDYEKITND
ncbi:molybdenum cofactor cytidylyltransferase [Clostridium sp. P21]|uniref:Molybdenum cofactor cytidylyltransferase n=1 Tax=Clostridium muellerianum TaxID=2716538 RepID=A0A7Y0EHX2_9CLOT|nr:molybdenum cofactor cytidylyltransferase [Clostridium muellerianum]NMM63788.1 molybdenum cofactor cytidylyltransferase [Clostridium muellerianum]